MARRRTVTSCRAAPTQTSCLYRGGTMTQPPLAGPCLVDGVPPPPPFPARMSSSHHLIAVTPSLQPSIDGTLRISAATVALHQ